VGTSKHIAQVFAGKTFGGMAGGAGGITLLAKAVAERVNVV
jgi:hypothetical protein